MEPNQEEIAVIFALFNGDVAAWLSVERALADDADRGITRLDVDLTLDDLRKRLNVPPLRNVPLPLRRTSGVRPNLQGIPRK